MVIVQHLDPDTVRTFTALQRDPLNLEPDLIRQGILTQLFSVTLAAKIKNDLINFATQV